MDAPSLHERPGCPGAAASWTPFRRPSKWLWVLTGLAGLAGLAWFVIRVLPKPSRASYPCQRVAAPLASSFVAWIAATLAASHFLKKARHHARAPRIRLVVLCLLSATVAGWLSYSMFPTASNADFVPEAQNAPMGVAQGLFPGRVVWIYDPDAASWDGATGFWWQDANTDQAQVDAMMDRALRLYTGEATAPSAWDVLFRHFNRTHGKGDVGYQSGETITIKVNLNNAGNYNSQDNEVDTSEQMTRALLRQLANQAGVQPSAITVYDAVRNINDVMYTRCQAEFPLVHYVDASGQQGREGVQWSAALIHYADPSIPDQRLPQCVVDADYFINFAALKKHSLAGVTLVGKNLCGSIEGGPASLHNGMDCRSRGMGVSNPLVDLMGHAQHGGKTLLYLNDALYSAPDQNGNPWRWSAPPFSNDWPSSLFLSQDGIAIESVAVDMLASQSTLYDWCDNYLHEAALADNPPSGAFYDPEGDGTRLSSLGVHEHWNSNTDKQYTRNLGTGDGIELLWERIGSGPAPDVVTTLRLVHTDPLVEGDALTFSATIENRSLVTPDANVHFSHRISPGLSGFTMTQPPSVGAWTWDPAGGPNGELTVDLAQLAPGTSVQLVYALVIDVTCTATPYRLCNVALTTSDWIRANEPGPRASDSGNGAPQEPSCTPDIQTGGARWVTLTKTVVPPEPRAPGDPVTYEVVIRNDGPCTLDGGTLDDDIPVGLEQFDPAAGVAVSPPGPTNASTGPGTGANGQGLARLEGISLPAFGGTVTVTITARLGNIPPCAVICNTARYRSAPSSGTIETQTTCHSVAAAYDILVTKSFSAPHDPVLEGDSVTYNLVVTNESPLCTVAGGELSDDIPAGVGFDLASANVRVVRDPGGNALNASQDPPAGAHGNGRIRFTGVDLPPGGASFEVACEVVALRPTPAPGICNQAAFAVSSSVFDGNQVCYVVDSVRVPGVIQMLALRRQGPDVVVESWQADPDAVSYSVYAVVASPPDKTLIASANAAGMAVHPGEIEEVCREVPLPPPACVHTGAAASPPACVFYEVVGVAANGQEGPNR